jgi:hypothetical protein
MEAAHRTNHVEILDVGCTAVDRSIYAADFEQVL